MELIALLDASEQQRHTARGDEAHRHVADLTGCDRATWARFNGLLRPFDADTLRKFSDGNDIEGRHLDAIAKRRPDLKRNVRVAMQIGFSGRIEGRIVSEEYEPAEYEIIGHPDGVLDDYVIESKSTEFMINRNDWKRIVPLTAADLQWHYKMQAGAYALALGKKRAVVIIECRASGAITAISFYPEEYEEEIKERIRDLVSLSPYPEKPEPTLHASTLNKRGESWLCKYCLVPQDVCSLTRYQVPVVNGREHVDI